jgi:hypothetical protein
MFKADAYYVIPCRSQSLLVGAKDGKYEIKHKQ